MSPPAPTAVLTPFGRRCWRWLLPAILAALPGVSEARCAEPVAEPVATAVLSPSEAPVGTRLELILTVRAPAGMLLDSPAIEEVPEGFGLLAADDPVLEREGDTQTLLRKVFLVPLAYGTLTLSLPPLRYRASGASDWRELPIPAPEVTVPRALDADAPLPPPAEPPPPIRMEPGTPWWIVALVLAGGLAAVAVWRHRRRGASEAPEPPLPPHRRALRDLDELETAGLVGKGQAPRFFDSYLVILRRYMIERYGLVAVNRTTQEIARSAREEPAFLDGHADLLEHAFATADYVRFARGEPGRGEEKAALDAARRFVLETAPPEEAPTP
jgi:hypothetical protein